MAPLALIGSSADHRHSSVGEADLIQLVTFRLGREEYGVEIMKVQEIIRWQEITRMPQMPNFIEGVINLRGKVIPILDLRKRFELGETSTGSATRIVVVSLDDHTLGVIADSVSKVLKFSSKLIEAPPPVIAGIGKEYLRGICKVNGRLIVLLDINRIITATEKMALQVV